MNTRQQAEKLAHALYHCTRGSHMVYRMHHSPTGKGFDIYVSWLGQSLTADGTPVCYVEALTLGEVPYILNCIAKQANTPIYVNVTANVTPRKRTIYILSSKYARGYRISAELATALHESAIRDDELSVTNSERIAFISLSDYIDTWQYTTIAPE